MVTYVKGDATKPIGEGKRMIVHIVNDEGGWGSGFVLALNGLSPLPKREYKATHEFWTSERGLAFIPLGEIEFVPVDEEQTLWVCNMVAQHRTIRSVPKPICYKSLEICLEKVAKAASENDFSIHMPKIGAGLAGGDWNVIESIINRTLTLKDVDVTVYEL